jgi:AcrR family transcriptional regulator
MLAAMADVCAERAVPNVTVAHIVERSGVSRRTFYEVFEDRDDCFLAAFDDALARASDYVLPAYRTAGTWRERIRAGLKALLEFLDDEPNRGRLLIAEALAAGPAALQRRQQVLTKIVAAIDEGRAEARNGAEPSQLTAEGVVGAVLSVIHSRVLEGSGEALSPLAGELMAMIVLPYAGPAASRRELARRSPSRAIARSPGCYEPLADIGMRMTYRTVCVLTALGSNPGASNRQVADAAGISDPGQISKLLTRLNHLGLIAKTAGEHARGEPNAWRLTAKGEEIERAIASQPAA